MHTAPAPNPHRPAARHGARPPSRPPRPLRQLATSLAATCRGQEAAVLARLSAAGVPVAGCTTPLELARSCHDTGDPVRSAAVVGALSALVPQDEVAGLCLLVAMTPTLSRMARRLARRGPDARSAEATAIGCLWEAAAISGTAGPDRLASLTWSALRTAERSERRHRARQEATAELPEVALEPPAVAESTGVLLYDARRAGAISFDQQALLEAAFVGDRSREALAAVAGSSVRTVTRRRAEALAALATFVTAGDR